MGAIFTVGVGRETQSPTKCIEMGRRGSGLGSLFSARHVWGSGSSPSAASMGKAQGRAGGRPGTSYMETAGKARRGLGSSGEEGL